MDGRMNSWDYVVTLIKKSQAKELDSTICLSGFVGEGKSTLAINFAKKYYNLNTQEKFRDFCNKWLIYSRDQLKDAVVNHKEKCIVSDEAVNMLFKRDFMQGTQKNLLKVLDVCRDHKHMFIFNIPSFWALDQHTVQTRVKLWILVEKQKFAHFFRPIRNPFTKDVWLRDYNEKLFLKKKSFTRSPNYITTLTFPPLTDEEYKIYWEVKTAKKLLATDEKSTVDDMTKKDVIEWLRINNPEFDYKTVAGLLKTNYKYVQRVATSDK
jgi:hypothetical protein